MTDEVTEVTEETVEAAQEEAKAQVVFTENHDGTVLASFPALNGTAPFEITIKNMNWGIFEDMDRIQRIGEPKERPQYLLDHPRVAAMLDFFREYVEGGPRAVPFNQTQTVFGAISQYLQQSAGSKN